MITSLNFPQVPLLAWTGIAHQITNPLLWKGIPIAYRYHPAVLRLIRGDNERGVRLRPRYRGKSKPALGYKRRQSYVTEEFADTFALYPVSNYRAETSLSSRKVDTSGMNEPITYPVGTGNVIGSHSAQDFVWAGRAEGSQEQTSGETATHTPADTNTPYAGPITEPVGSDVHYGAEKVSWSTIKTLNYYIGTAAIIIGVGGFVGILSTQLRANKLWGVGTLFTGVKDSWDSKDIWSKTLMLTTFGSLVYLGWTASTMTYRYSGRSTVGQ